MKKIKLILIIVSVILVGLFTCYVITLAIGSSTAKRLAEFGEKQFLENDFENYINNLCTSEIDDIKGRATFSYTYQTDYDKTNHVLYLDCKVNNFTSDKIDDYYTDTYNKSPGNTLARVLTTIDNRLVDREYSYTLKDVGTVIINVGRESYGLTLTTSEGREYFYDYPIQKDMFTVQIDGNFVYLKTNFKTSTSDMDNNGDNKYYTKGRECALGHCDHTAKDGSPYCHTHGCCIDGCTNKKDPMVHCCDTHNCKHTGCGAHRYTAADSNYCGAHYDDH